MGLEGGQFSTVLGWERDRHRIATLHPFPCIRHPSFLLSNEIYVNISRERGGNQQLLRGRANLLTYVQAAIFSEAL